ncbi:vWA domain-containing protein [Erysipelothrix tonsillarum]|uniref:vWA domain-containing protein n=1 Tax=Erysipelothrix tonsillarum TaxID=38402 RepID=UPI00036D60A8|nr:vWA domain-containing protein [Erysipelothrix tonsillarum]
MKKKLFKIFLIIACGLFLVPINLSADQGEEHQISDQDITVKKSTKWLNKNTGELEVTLLIKSPKNIMLPTPKSVDVVLVLDVSNSMKEKLHNGQSKIDMMKEGSKELVDSLLSQNGFDNNLTVNVGIIPFDRYDKDALGGYVPLTNNETKLKNGIDKMKASGGTNIHAGILSATDMLSQSTADDKYMVVLSDGLPTYHNQVDGGKIVTDFYDYSYDKPTKFEQNYFLTSKSTKVVGSGSDVMLKIFARYNVLVSNSFKKIIDNARPAISAAYTAKKDENIHIFSIAYDLASSSDGQEILKAIASNEPNSYHSAVDNLNEIFNDIAGAIVDKARVVDAKVEDVMHRNILGGKDNALEVKPESIKKYIDGEEITKDDIIDAHYDEITKTVHWSIKGNLKPEIEYKLVYQTNVDLNSLIDELDFIFETSSHAQSTTMNYTNSDDHKATIAFKQPSISVVSYQVELYFDGVKTSDSEVGVVGFEIDGENEITIPHLETITEQDRDYVLTGVDYGGDLNRDNTILKLDANPHANVVKLFYETVPPLSRKVEVRYFKDDLNDLIGSKMYEVTDNQLALEPNLLKTDHDLNDDANFYYATIDGIAFEEDVRFDLKENQSHVDVIYKKRSIQYSVSYHQNDINEPSFYSEGAFGASQGDTINIDDIISSTGDMIESTITNYRTWHHMKVYCDGIEVDDVTNIQLVKNNHTIQVVFIPNTASVSLRMVKDSLNDDTFYNEKNAFVYGDTYNIKDSIESHQNIIQQECENDCLYIVYIDNIETVENTVLLEKPETLITVLFTDKTSDISIDYYIDSLSDKNYLGTLNEVALMNSDLKVDQTAFKDDARFDNKALQYDAHINDSDSDIIKITEDNQKIVVVYTKDLLKYHIYYINEETNESLVSNEGIAYHNALIDAKESMYLNHQYFGTLFNHFQTVKHEPFIVSDDEMIFNVFYRLNSYETKISYFEGEKLLKTDVFNQKAGTKLVIDPEKYLTDEMLNEPAINYIIDGPYQKAEELIVLKNHDINIVYSTKNIEPKPGEPKPGEPKPGEPKPDEPKSDTPKQSDSKGDDTKTKGSTSKVKETQLPNTGIFDTPVVRVGIPLIIMGVVLRMITQIRKKHTSL